MSKDIEADPDSLEDDEFDLDDIDVEKVRALVAEADADPPGGEISLDALRAKYGIAPLADESPRR